MGGPPAVLAPGVSHEDDDDDEEWEEEDETPQSLRPQTGPKQITLTCLLTEGQTDRIEKERKLLICVHMI